jgi:small nuclear ribonucleoprotein (snRNP)-like protein
LSLLYEASGQRLHLKRSLRFISGGPEYGSGSVDDRRNRKVDLQSVVASLIIYIVIIIMENYDNPLDMVQKNIGNRLYVRLRNRTEIEGVLVAYDEHLNMMIESVSIRKAEQTQQKKLMYLRGDTVLLLAKK